MERAFPQRSGDGAGGRRVRRASSSSMDERIKTVQNSVRGLLKANSFSGGHKKGEPVSEMDRKLRQLERLRANIRPETQLFGRTLAEVVASGRVKHGLPEPMYDCIAYLNSRGLGFEGLYRIPGSKLSVDVYQAMFDSGRRVHFVHHEEPNTVSSLLLAFVRQIPGGLFGPIAAQLREALRGRPHDVDAVRPVLATLSPEHRLCLGELMYHLRRVADNSDVNKMTPTNLATCIFPTSLGSVVLMITRCEDLFPPSIVQDLPPAGDDDLSEGSAIQEEGEGDADGEPKAEEQRKANWRRWKSHNDADAKGLDAPVPAGSKGAGSLSVHVRAVGRSVRGKLGLRKAGSGGGGDANDDKPKKEQTL